MLKFIRAFENTLLILIKAALILLLFMLFYLFYSTESPEFYRSLHEFSGLESINRVTAITSSTFLVLCFVMMKVYGGFCIGQKSTKEIIIAMVTAVGFTDVFTYLQLCVMEKGVMKLSTLALVFGAQIVVTAVLTKLSTNLYYTIHPPRKLLIFHNNDKKLKQVLHKLNGYQHRFSVEKIMRYDEPELHRSIRAASCVLMVDVPVDMKEYIIEYCYKRNKEVYFTPAVGDILTNNAKHELIDDISLLAYEHKGLTIEQKLVKRFFDFTLSLTAVIILSPIMLAEALAIKLEDGGAVFYRQERVTLGGKPFSVLKFRTMVADAENNGAVLSGKDDKRITRVGSFLRKTRLDELPQLFNILAGDMSLVGPRPERPMLAEEYERDLPEFSYRLRVKAGLTGLAQIKGKYSTTPKDKLVLDLMYIEQYSLWLDLKIMFQTIVTCLTPEKTEGIDGEPPQA